MTEPAENPKWLILTALRLEARAVAGAFSAVFPPQGDEILLATQSGTARLCLIGMGAGRLSAGHFAPGILGVILAGLGGGLSPTLKAGDVVIDCPANDPLPKLHPCGKIHGSDKIIGTPAEKAELFRATGALAVDMESHIVRARCVAAGVPFWCVRGISDAANQTIPTDFAAWMDETGKLRPGAVAAGVMKKPWRIPEMVRLGRASKVACLNVGKAVFEFLNSNAVGEDS